MGPVILDTALRWDQRTRRIRSDKRRNKKWRLFRDRLARPLLRVALLRGNLFR